MILSTQVVDNKKDEEDDESSSENDLKDEGLKELKKIMKTNEENKQTKISEIGKKSKKNLNVVGDDSSYNLSKIEFKNQSINSSMRSLSRGEDFIQKDILQVLNGGNNVSKILI